MRKNFKARGLLLLLVLVGGFLLMNQARADEASELQAKIDAHNQKIKTLETEIAGYQKSLNATSAQVGTLAGELARINLEAKKLDADLKVTQNQIERS